jgi:glycosyltransferase involved in cell wall biosynthesis
MVKACEHPAVSSRGLAHRIRLDEPRVGARSVEFRWEVTPASELYRRTHFRVEFPAEVELGRVPRALWWRFALICLHGHWALLRPCRVELPVDLGSAELHFWARMADNVARQLEAYGSAPRGRHSVQLVGAGEALGPVEVSGRADRAAVAFSGGKDSLALSALLAELTERPLLVTTTSPVPWARDHVGAARRETLSGVDRRLAVDLVEVESDFRTAWELDFSGRDGCRIGVHELSDLPLFQAVTIAVAAASGIRSTYMASEADLQYNAARDGEVIQHPEFLSSAVHQASLSALLAGFGMRQGSVLYPLHMPQVQKLLLRRYPQVVGLQYSCWQAPEGTRACSACDKCLQIALVTLDEGVSPTAMGIDPVQVLCSRRAWRLDSQTRHRAPPLHETRAARQHVIRVLQSLRPEQLDAILEADPLTREDPRRAEALAAYEQLRARALPLNVPPAPGYIGGFLDWVHEDLRGPLRAIFDEHFAPAEEHEFARTVGRARSLVQQITEPLAQTVALGSVPGAPLHLCLVCRDVTTDAAGGLAQAMADLAEALAQEGHRVSLLTDHSAAGPRGLDGVDVRQVAVPPVSWPAPPESALHNLMHAAGAYREVVRIHEYERPVDAVLAPLWRSEGAICMLDERFPTVVSCMTSLRTLTEIDPGRAVPEELAQRLALERASLARARYIHGLTDAVLDKTIADYGLEPELAAVVGRGLSDRRTSPADPCSNGAGEPARVLFVGRIERRKGVDVLLEAARELIGEGAPVRFTLAGPEADRGVLEEFSRHAAAEPELRAAVRLAGPVPEAELLKLYAEADIVCVPSRYESHGIVLLEAMMFGKPIVTCPVGGIPEIVSDGREALLCPPEDPHALARSLRSLVGDRELRARLGAQGRASYEARFESRAVARRMEGLFGDVLEHHRARTPVPDPGVPALLRELIAEALSTTAGQASELAGELLQPTAEAWSAWAREHDPERSGWQRHAEWADARLRTITGSRSWRLTEPARRLGAHLRGRRRTS